jgi:Sortase (surface protein transpeptidase)
MSRTQHAIRRAVVLAAAPCLALTVLTGCSSGTAQKVAAQTAEPSPSTPPNKPGEPAPTQVTIPSIGVDSELMRLGLNADGTVEVPPAEKGMTAGWYAGSAVPGQTGAAVLIGHNDTRFGKAVFHDLRKIRKGADVFVVNGAGAKARFTVTDTETVRKDAFPTTKVYGRTKDRVLRLITCDGDFDVQGHPVDNLIVYAALR